MEGSKCPTSTPVANVTETASVETQQAFTPRRILTLTSFVLSEFAVFMSVFWLSTFYPELGTKKGLTGIEIGVVVGMPKLFSTISIYGTTLTSHIVAPRRCIPAGLLLCGISVIAFQFTENITSSRNGYLAACLIIRAIQGAGLAAVDVSVYTLLAEFSPPKHRFLIFGASEFSVTLGIGLAPFLGGILYEIYGSTVSYAALTAVIIGLAGFTLFSIEPHSNVKRISPLMALKFSFAPLMLFLFIILCACSLSLGLLTGLVEPLLTEFSLSHYQVGLISVVCAVTTGITSPIWGLVTDHLIPGPYLSFIGSILSGIGCIILGPALFVHFERKIWTVIFAAVLNGIGTAAVLVSSYIQIRDILYKYSGDEGFTNVLSSTCYVAFSNTGIFLGTFFGGYFIEGITYGEGSAILFGVHIFSMVCQASLLFIQRRSSCDQFDLEKP